MTPEDWVQLAAWADERDKRIYNRLLLNRFFQGYVTAVSGTIPPYHCQIQRIGEAQADGADYLSPNPGYFPKVGDLVECVWRDDSVAYVLWPITGVDRMRFRAKAHATSATTIVNSPATTAFTTIILNTVDWDPNGDFNASTYTYQPRQSGIYHFTWRVAMNTTTSGGAILVASLFKNLTEVSRANAKGGEAGGVFEMDVIGSDEQYMNGSTDFVNLGATQSRGTDSLSLIGANNTAFLSAELIAAQ